MNAFMQKYTGTFIAKRDNYVVEINKEFVKIGNLYDQQMASAITLTRFTPTWEQIDNTYQIQCSILRTAPLRMAGRVHRRQVKFTELGQGHDELNSTSV